MTQIPDHPAIARAERTGYPGGETYPTCPVCGEEADTYYKSREGDILGGEWCVKEIDLERIEML